MAPAKNETGSEHDSSLKGKNRIHPATLLDGEIASFMAGFAEREMDMRSMQALAIRWGKLDPRAAAPFILNRPELADSFRYWILERLAEVDLPAAKAAAARQEQAVRLESERIILAFLLERDVRAALVYARGLKNNEAEAGALCKLAESDPMAAAAELTPGREDQKDVVEFIAFILLEKDRRAFEAWAASLSDPAQRAAVRYIGLRAKAAEDPGSAAREAAAWLAEKSPALETLPDSDQAYLRDIAEEAKGNQVKDRK